MNNVELVAAYLLDGHGHGQEIDLPTIQAWSKEKGILWVHLDYKKSNAQSWLEEKFELPEMVSKALFTEDVRPKTSVYPEGILTFLRGINLNPGEPPEDMVSIRCWITKDFIITSRARHVYAIDDLRNSFANGQGAKNTHDFLVDLIDNITHRINETVEEVDERFDTLEEEILLKQDIKLKTKIGLIRRIIIQLRRHLTPQREALLQIEKLNILTEENQQTIQESQHKIIRYIEDLDAIKDRAMLLQEELMNLIAEQMNHRMYILSAIAAIFLPITFISGLLGVNVGGIPGTEHPYAFIILCVLLLGIAIIQAIFMFKSNFFRSKKKKK